jgi:hypothetical protein
MGDGIAPPPYNFARIPVVSGSEPLWCQDGPGEAAGLRADIRELVVTTAAEAEPDLRETSPQPSIWPFLAAIATGIAFIWSIFTPWGAVWGSIPVAVTLIFWFWPKGSPEDEQ